LVSSTPLWRAAKEPKYALFVVLRKSAFSKTKITIRSKYLPGTMPFVDEEVEIGTAAADTIIAVTKESSFMVCLVDEQRRRNGWDLSGQSYFAHYLCWIVLLAPSKICISIMSFGVNTENADSSDNVEPAKTGLCGVLSWQGVFANQIP
jgi:hypothetical protein